MWEVARCCSLRDSLLQPDQVEVWLDSGFGCGPEEGVSVVRPVSEAAFFGFSGFCVVVFEIRGEAVEGEVVAGFLVNEGLVAVWVHREFIEESGSD